MTRILWCYIYFTDLVIHFLIFFFFLKSIVKDNLKREGIYKNALLVLCFHYYFSFY